MGNNWGKPLIKNEAIIKYENNDPRFPIENHSIYPYCYIGRVWTKIIDRSDSQKKEGLVKGTGFVVGARTILTAAHNIDPYQELRNQINAVKTTYSPSFLHNSQTFVCKEIYIPPEYYSGDLDTNEYDWAVMILSDNIEQTTMKVCNGVPKSPTLQEYNDDQIKELPISVVGFPTESKNDRLMEMKGGISELLNPRQFIHTISTSPGQSGGPVYVVHNNQTYFVGIHKAAYEKDGDIKANLAIRITPQIKQKVAETLTLRVGER